jgi:UDP-N-acetylglucosamine--N-acetylmuramyl-(pentapeptide) pyrophosphoryl-undecaprenol N-acetylglucosamine transferase
VRPQFAPRDAGTCRAELGLDPQRPVVLVMGGSQGATSINDLVLRTLPTLAERAPQLQWLHLAGVKDCEKVRDQYARLKLTGVVHAFFEDMPCALGAAAVAVSRAGASSLAELAAMQVPSVLIPFPAAADNHQLSNALAFEKVGAARLLEQRSATAESLSQAILDLLGGGGPTEKMRAALGRWHAPHAAQQIAEAIISQISQAGAVASAKQISRAGSLHRHQSAWI